LRKRKRLLEANALYLHEANAIYTDVRMAHRSHFAHACKMALEGIVSKRKDSPYRSGRSPDWLKMKNANALAAVSIGST
jgi:bifunctional non-homologous end joining protein LigD